MKHYEQTVTRVNRATSKKSPPRQPDGDDTWALVCVVDDAMYTVAYWQREVEGK